MGYETRENQEVLAAIFDLMNVLLVNRLLEKKKEMLKKELQKIEDKKNRPN